MKEEEKKILKDSGDALTESGIKLEVAVLNPTLFQKLRKQTMRTFYLRPASLGTLIKISRALLAIEIKTGDGTNWMELSQQLILDHSDTMAKVVAYAIVNRKKDPSDELISFIKFNLAAKELSQIMSLVVTQMNITDFINSIVSIKGINVLETSLKKQGS